MAAIGVALLLPDGGDFPRGLTALFAQCHKTRRALELLPGLARGCQAGLGFVGEGKDV